MARPLSNKILKVVISPDTYDRQTEQPFRSLFKELDFIAPPRGLLQDFFGKTATGKDVVLEPHDVLLFEGGTDISPSLYHEKKGKWTQDADDKRDKHEVALFERARTLQIPMIGICRGAQLLCALNGGHIIQDVKGHNVTMGHPMRIPKYLGDECIWTTSVHHQMMNPYSLPASKWVSYGWTATHLSLGNYFGEHNSLMKYQKVYKNWQEQEILWFPETRSLCIQGHPEYQSATERFVRYCQYLVCRLILNLS